MSDNLRDAGEMLYKLQWSTQKIGLEINYNKTRMMTKLVPSEEDTAIEIVEKCIYLEMR